MKSNKPVTLFNGDKMYVDEHDSNGIRALGICSEKGETEFVQEFVKEGMHCVDIGANLGYYTLLMSRRAESVQAFEPEKENYQTLIDNITLNGRWNKVGVCRAAVGEESGYTTLYKCGTNNGMHRIYPSKWCSAGEEKVPMTSLDLILGARVRIDFIKMDVEGSELGALKGMKGILEMDKPTIMMEFNVPSIKEYGREPKEIYDYMINMGYDISLPSRHVIWEELNKLGEQPGINIVCTPRRK